MTEKVIYSSFSEDSNIPTDADAVLPGTGFGYTGSQGNTGPTGPIGQRGQTGYTGSAGLNGYSFAIVGSAPPQAPVEGTLWYDDTQSQQQLKIYISKYGWVPIALPTASV